ncbi:hypothetical protein [Pseudomonas amygdali]|nr:hypothetical protein [Pseudomonas amygdali]
MGLKDELFRVVSGYQSEASRTRLLVEFVSRSAMSEAAHIKNIYTDVAKHLSGEIVNAPGPNMVLVPSDLLVRLSEPLSSHGDALLSLPDLLLRMAYVHLITLFEAALSDVVRASLLHMPKMLKSKRQMSYEDILSESDMSSLVKKIVEKEISDLTYGSVEEFVDYLKVKLHLPIEFLPEEIVQLSRCKGLRNLLVHNQGVVDARFLKERLDTQYAMGDAIVIGLQDWDSAHQLFGRVIKALENSVIRKFRLV